MGQRLLRVALRLLDPRALELDQRLSAIPSGPEPEFPVYPSEQSSGLGRVSAGEQPLRGGEAIDG